MKTYNLDIKENCAGLISSLKKTIQDFDPNSYPSKRSPVSPPSAQVTIVIPPMTTNKRKITIVVEEEDTDRIKRFKSF